MKKNEKYQNPSGGFFLTHTVDCVGWGVITNLYTSSDITLSYLQMYRDWLNVSCMCRIVTDTSAICTWRRAHGNVPVYIYHTLYQDASDSRHRFVVRHFISVILVAVTKKHFW